MEYVFTKDEREQLYRDAVSTWGDTHQIVKMIEECAELTHALSRWINNANSTKKDYIIDELVDVGIVHEQLQYIFREMYGDDDTYIKRMNFKLQRLKERIDNRERINNKMINDIMRRNNQNP